MKQKQEKIDNNTVLAWAFLGNAPKDKIRVSASALDCFSYQIQI